MADKTGKNGGEMEGAERQNAEETAKKTPAESEPSEGSYSPLGESEEASEAERLRALINTPEILDFVKAVQLEAVHQRERWGSQHDDGKSAADWFWLRMIEAK